MKVRRPRTHFKFVLEEFDIVACIPWAINGSRNHDYSMKAARLVTKPAHLVSIGNFVELYAGLLTITRVFIRMVSEGEPAIL